MYEINSGTVAIIPTTDFSCEILEYNKKIIIEESVKSVINNSCKYFGSSYEGRVAGTKNILGVNYKAPIVVEESDDLIFFPTASPRVSDCVWISLKNIKDYKKNGKKTIMTFINNYQVTLNISYKSLDNQILRAARLQMLLKNRKLRKNC